MRADQVYEFDIYQDERLLKNPHLGYFEMAREAPEIFYTPHNGGHWLVTNYELVTQVISEHESFSNNEIEVPKTESPIRAIPINLDPPAHTPYRKMLMKHFTPKVIAGLEDKMHHWSKELIGKVQDRGACDFATELGALYPVTIFMEMAGLPLDRYVEFRNLVTEFFGQITRERRIELQRKMLSELKAVFDDRRENPQDDLFTKLVNEEIDGRPLTEDELLSIGFLLFVAGLDTVANALTFGFNHLAHNPALQDRLRENPDDIKDFFDESMRRFPVTNGVRLIRKDMELAGAHLKAGEMIVAPMTLAGLDPEVNDNPTEFDIDRKGRKHVGFSTGPHLCLGHWMARAEVRIFIEEFLTRIPRFRVKSGFEEDWRAGVVMSLESLPLEWEVPGKA
ncbi:cytochrome P450 [uncultured Croceicoccus sp.]|uniref:cytochrome P450 n=1 Tax=uncultured Croceicoccus sp. TaxID=1295329 RepID=UPI0026226626|nr:cytochrome P450 [uncultured Croceicoccus sp.]